jgi:hypothetical protein
MPRFDSMKEARLRILARSLGATFEQQIDVELEHPGGVN